MRQRVILLGIGMSILFGGILSFIFKLNTSKQIDLYTYQVGIYNEKQNALDMINTLSSYNLKGLSYLKNNQHYVIACLTMDKSELLKSIQLLNANGIKGIEKNYVIDSIHKEEIINQNYEEVLKVISTYDS